MGWQPLTERIGRQVCEHHWDRHKNKSDRFNLFDTFGFRKPTILLKANPEEQPERCACGEELQPGHRLCKKCGEERERNRKRESYHQKKDEERQSNIIKITTKRCAICSKPKEPNHKYCSRCAKQKRRELDRTRKQEKRKTRIG